MAITRLLRHRDLKQVLAIEEASFDPPWTEEEFRLELRQPHCGGTVAEDRYGNLVGYVIYHTMNDRIRIVNLAVDPTRRREGIASQIIERLKEKLINQRRSELHAETRESNLEAQLLLKSNGFHAHEIYDEWFDNGESAYHFEWEQFPDCEGEDGGE